MRHSPRQFLKKWPTLTEVAKDIGKEKTVAVARWSHRNRIPGHFGWGLYQAALSPGKFR